MPDTTLLTGPYRWLAFQTLPEYRHWLWRNPKTGLAINYAHRGRVVFAPPGGTPVTRLAPVAWFTEPGLHYAYGLRPKDPGWWEHRYALFSGAPQANWVRRKLWPKPEEPHFFFVSKANEVKRAFDHLLWYLGHEPDRHRAPEALLSLLELLKTERLTHRALEKGESRIERFADELARKFSEPITLKALAQEQGYTLEAASLAFFRRFGVRPAAWRETKRMEFATELLRHGGLNIREIARRCGFGDAYTFSKGFKRWSGKAPSLWRGKD